MHYNTLQHTATYQQSSSWLRPASQFLQSGRPAGFRLYVLQCIAACCSVLQCVATWVSVNCSALHYAAGSQSVWSPSLNHVIGVLQCVAVCCSVLQCVAVCCSVLQRVHSYNHIFSINGVIGVLQCAAVCCSEVIGTFTILQSIVWQTINRHVLCGVRLSCAVLCCAVLCCASISYLVLSMRMCCAMYCIRVYVLCCVVHPYLWIYYIVHPFVWFVVLCSVPYTSRRDENISSNEYEYEL